MSKQAWQRHAAEVGYFSLNVFERHNHAQDCGICQERRVTQKQNRARRERDGAMRSLGLTKTPYGWE